MLRTIVAFVIAAIAAFSNVALAADEVHSGVSIANMICATAERNPRRFVALQQMFTSADVPTKKEVEAVLVVGNFRYTVDISDCINPEASDRDAGMTLVLHARNTSDGSITKMVIHGYDEEPEVAAVYTTCLSDTCHRTDVLTRNTGASDTLRDAWGHRFQYHAKRIVDRLKSP